MTQEYEDFQIWSQDPCPECGADADYLRGLKTLLRDGDKNYYFGLSCPNCEAFLGRSRLNDQFTVPESLRHIAILDPDPPDDLSTIE